MTTTSWKLETSIKLMRGGVTVTDKWIETEGGARIKAYRILRGPTSWTA